MPAIQFADLQSVPEVFRSLAKAVAEGKPEVTINVVDAAKLDEFRDTNIATKKELETTTAERDALKAIVGDDPATFANELTDLRTVNERVKAGELKAPADIENAVAKRTEELRKNLENQISEKARGEAAWKTKHAETDAELKRAYVMQYIKDAANNPESGLIPQAVGDVVKAGLDVFKMGDDRKIKAYDGEAPIYGGDGTQSLSAKEFIEKLKDSHPYYFQRTSGGGANGDGTVKTAIGEMTPAAMKAMNPRQLLDLANGDVRRKS